MFLLSEELIFPPVHLADEDGLLALGGELSPERLLLAYRSGIFPGMRKMNRFAGGALIPALYSSPNPCTSAKA